MSSGEGRRALPFAVVAPSSVETASVVDGGGRAVRRDTAAAPGARFMGFLARDLAGLRVCKRW